MTALSIKDDFVVLLPASLLLERLFGYGAKGNSPPTSRNTLTKPSSQTDPTPTLLSALLPVPNKILLLARSRRQWRLKAPAYSSP